MQHIKRSGFSMKNQWLNVLRSSYKGLKRGPSNPVSDLGFAGFSSQVAERSVVSNSIVREEQWARQHALFHQSPFRLATSAGQNMRSSCFVRGFASNTTESNRPKESQTRKEISTVEDPFDAPTYNIPQKPVTFTEGASYSLIILAGLGIAGIAAYAVFKELIIEPKEYKIFNKALNRVQNDSQVRVRIGSPVTGYGSESRNRSARQRIPNKTWTDEDGVEHIVVNFHVRGPHGAGKVYSEMFKDKVDKQWKFMYLIVEVTSPSPAQLMLESYVPA
ncbi:probable mitochondrial import inner membrane translocase subunit tim21 [Phtheirospermum japonicum]|uniref:Mitochondrial import inner membrane translocase subunit Tim21 n=1 Tax=Phtheirospermum japonicum TaxID=374723 RepID=A0A830BXC5_9LAMI|nr:probable mitochondrial import inner membrane translocase subunit tim21 [Phtheirospermum japonicum]